MSAPTSAKATRGGALDALRALAAIFIVTFHFGDEAPVSLRAVSPFFDRGYLATDFFLLLSGFVLAKAYGGSLLSGRVGAGQFLLKRLTRVYPAHLIILAVLVAMVIGAQAVGHHFTNAEQFQWWAIPFHLLLLHGWGVAAGTWNTQSWTLSALFACYMAFPALWSLMQRVKAPFAFLAMAIVMVVGGDLLSRTLLGQELFVLPFRWGLARAAPLFVAGLALAGFVQAKPLSASTARALALGGVAVFAADAVWNGSNLLAVVATAAVIVGFGAAPSGRRWPGAEWGAKVSFSLFITHAATGAAYFDGLRPLLLRLHPGPAGQWAIWVGSLAFALGAAVAFHHLIDDPIQRRLRDGGFRPRPALRPAPPPSA